MRNQERPLKTMREVQGKLDDLVGLNPCKNKKRDKPCLNPNGSLNTKKLARDRRELLYAAKKGLETIALILQSLPPETAVALGTGLEIISAREVIRNAIETAEVCE
jgi:hypothetical protein